MASNLGQLKGCLYPPCKLLEVILAGNLLEFPPPGQHIQLLCTPLDPLHAFHRGRFRHWGSWEADSDPLLARSISPLRNSWTWGSRGGRHLRYSSSGLDLSDWSPGLPSSLQVSRWGSFTSVFLSGLLPDDEGVKVTHHLNQEGLGDWSHLLAWSPWCDTVWETLVQWSTVWETHSLVAAWASVASRMLATVAEGMAHPLYFIFQQCHSAMTLWWASLAMAKASSQESCLTSMNLL